jgi:hypothetical protein
MMMRYRIAPFCFAVALGVFAAGPAAAQATAPASAEATAGLRSGQGGTYVNRGGADLDLLFGFRFTETAAGSIVGGLALGAQFTLVSLDLCLVLPDGGCAPDFPSFVTGSALLGVQRGTARTASVRVLAGLAHLRALEGGAAFGVQGRLDLATPPWQRVAGMVFLRHTALPSFRDERVSTTSGGLGLRFQ